MELSEQATQELAEGSVAIGQVVELEARVAELEAQGRRLETEKALCKEKRGKESDFCLSRVLFALFVFDSLIRGSRDS